MADRAKRKKRKIKMMDHAGEHELEVWMAETFSERALGLSGLDQLEEDGMLFVRPVSDQGAFHMGDVRFPLLIAFFDSGGQLVDQVPRQPGDGPWRPQRAFKYALELKQLQELAPETILAL